MPKMVTEMDETSYVMELEFIKKVLMQEMKNSIYMLDTSFVKQYHSMMQAIDNKLNRNYYDFSISLKFVQRDKDGIILDYCVPISEEDWERTIMYDTMIFIITSNFRTIYFMKQCHDADVYDIHQYKIDQGTLSKNSVIGVFVDDSLHLPAIANTKEEIQINKQFQKFMHIFEKTT